MCVDDSWFRENTTKIWSAFQKTRTDRTIRPANTVCARLFRAALSFDTSFVIVGVSRLFDLKHILSVTPSSVVQPKEHGSVLFEAEYAHEPSPTVYLSRSPPRGP